MELHLQKLTGNWKEGIALDLHTNWSIPDSDSPSGWMTSRPPIAEELYQLKYCHDKTKVNIIATEVVDYFSKNCSHWEIDVIVPIPPSDTSRAFQPVYELADSIGKKLKIPVDKSSLLKTKSTSQLKSIEDPDERKKILQGAFDIKLTTLQNKNVLLFDDLFRSGETLNTAGEVILRKGKAKNIYVLTITKTRSKR